MTGPTTVLVTGAGGPAGRALGSQLSARAASAVDAAVGRAVAWVGVDVVPVAGGAFPVTDQAPRADAWDYVTGMRDLVVRYAPDLVIPTVQDELPQVATLAQALAGESPSAGRWTLPDAVGVVLTADPGPAALAADKLLTMLALEKAGVPVPPVRGADGLRQHGGGAGVGGRAGGGQAAGVARGARGAARRVGGRPAVGDLVEIRVDDQGRGIPPDKLETIFGRFEQVDASDTRERGGSGLGLTIARSIVEGHGGHLWAVSDGTGASFRFTLHRAAPHPAQDQAGQDQAGQDTTRPTHQPAHQVVVVDDDPHVADVLRTALEEHGYQVLGLTDGQAALTAVRQHRPAAVVLDLALPGTHGTEVLDRLRRSAATTDVPVVVLSATSPHDAGATAALADDWLVKSVDPDRIAETVREVIRRQPHHGRVLVVEDHRDLRAVLATVLRNAGLVVTAVSGVGDARAALAQGPTRTWWSST